MVCIFFIYNIELFAMLGQYLSDNSKIKHYKFGNNYRIPVKYLIIQLVSIILYVIFKSKYFKSTKYFISSLMKF